MIDLTNPHLLAFIAAICTGDEVAVRACVDWLQEQGATLADVVYLYALPPVWEEEEKEKLYGYPVIVQSIPEEDDSLRPLLACWCEAHGDKERAKRVQSGHVFLNEADSWIVEGIAGMSGHSTKGEAFRELKRRVLLLFNEIMYGRCCFIPFRDLKDIAVESVDDFVNDRLREQGFLEHTPFRSAEDQRNQGIDYWQQFRPAELVAKRPVRWFSNRPRTVDRSHEH